MPQLALLDEAFEDVDGRRKILEPLAERDKLDTAPDGVEFALDVLDSPAIERQRLDVAHAV